MEGRTVPSSETAAAATPTVVPSSRHDNPDTETLLRLYRQMLLIRRFEERVYHLFLQGEIPGTLHQCQGQEAVAVGICEQLDRTDWITSTHRPHGHALAK